MRSGSVSGEALAPPVTESSEPKRYKLANSIVSAWKWHWLPCKAMHTSTLLPYLR